MSFTETEDTFAVEGTRLYKKTWTPTGPILAKLVFIHGYSDHINSYINLFHPLAKRGILVTAFDQRGWGRSVKEPSHRGRTGPTAVVLADISSFLRHTLALEPKSAPLFVMGSSMGGQETLTIASDPQIDDILPKIRGFIVSAPYIALTTPPSQLLVTGGRILSRILPNFQMKNELDPSFYSRDPELPAKVKADSLRHDIGTLEGLAGMLDRAAALDTDRVTLRPGIQSLLVAHGTDDKVISFPRAKAWFDRVGKVKVQDAKFAVYEGGYHELHTDLCKDAFVKDVGDWVLERVEKSADAETGKAVEEVVPEVKPESKL